MRYEAVRRKLCDATRVRGTEEGVESVVKESRHRAKSLAHDVTPMFAKRITTRPKHCQGLPPLAVLQSASVAFHMIASSARMLHKTEACCIVPREEYRPRILRTYSDEPYFRPDGWVQFWWQPPEIEFDIIKDWVAAYKKVFVVICCQLSFVCCLLFAVCCWLFVVCCLLFVVGCLLFGVCCLLLLVVCRLLCAV